MGHTFKNGSHFQKWVTLTKRDHSYKKSVVVLLVILLCHVLSNIFAFIQISFRKRIPPNITITALFGFTLLPVLNSLFNSLIYAVRIRYFRVAFFQLLTRKSILQAEELEKEIFGPRQI